MKCVLAGIGQAGGKLADALVQFDHQHGYDSVQDAIAINSAKTDLQSLAIDTVLIGQSHLKGHGVGGDNERAAELMEADLAEVQETIGNRITSQAESIILTTDLAGGQAQVQRPCWPADSQQSMISLCTSLLSSQVPRNRISLN